MKRIFLVAFLVAVSVFIIPNHGVVQAKHKSVPWWQMPVSWSHGQGDMGEDIATPVWTPLTSLCSGPIVGAGYYGGGGVVTIRCSGVGDVYVQHMDAIASWIGRCAPYGDDGLQACRGQWASYGSLLGYSGGDCGWHFYGNPCPDWSNGPHTEVGINPTGWFGIWGSEPHPGPNYDPYSFVQKGGNRGGGQIGSGGASDHEPDGDTDDSNGGTPHPACPYILGSGAGSGWVNCAGKFIVGPTGPCPCNSLILIAGHAGTTAAHLYSKNASIIVAIARAHGVRSDYVAYVYTGEQLNL